MAITISNIKPLTPVVEPRTKTAPIESQGAPEQAKEAATTAKPVPGAAGTDRSLELLRLLAAGLDGKSVVGPQQPPAEADAGTGARVELMAWISSTVTQIGQKRQAPAPQEEEGEAPKAQLAEDEEEAVEAAEVAAPAAAMPDEGEPDKQVASAEQPEQADMPSSYGPKGQVGEGAEQGAQVKRWA